MASDDQAAKIVVKLLKNDPQVKKLTVNCFFGVSLETFQLLADAIKNSTQLTFIGLMTPTRDFSLQQNVVAQSKSIIDALKVNKSVQEFYLDEVHEPLASDITEMLNVKTDARMV